jgi:hypothetical protein
LQSQRASREKIHKLDKRPGNSRNSENGRVGPRATGTASLSWYMPGVRLCNELDGDFFDGGLPTQLIGTAG